MVAFALTGMLNRIVRRKRPARKKKTGREDVQPRVKADLTACRTGGELLARIGEAGLRDCVVLLVELKGNGVARLRGDIRGVEG